MGGGNGVVKVEGIPHPFFLGAKQKLASVWRGWRDVLGTDKALAVSNPPARLLVTARVPCVTSLMPFGGGCSISEPWRCSEVDKATLEDLSQWGAQAGSSTGRVRGIFGLPRHAEEESGDDGLFSPRLDEMVTADVGMCLCLVSQLFKRTAVTYGRGGQRSDPSCCPQNAQGTCPALFSPHQTLEGCNWWAQHPQEWAVLGCTTLHTCARYTVSSMVPSCREQYPWDPKSWARIPSPLWRVWLPGDPMAQVSSSCRNSPFAENQVQTRVWPKPGMKSQQ